MRTFRVAGLRRKFRPQTVAIFPACTWDACWNYYWLNHTNWSPQIKYNAGKRCATCEQRDDIIGVFDKLISVTRVKNFWSTHGVTAERFAPLWWCTKNDGCVCHIHIYIYIVKNCTSIWCNWINGRKYGNPNRCGCWLLSWDGLHVWKNRCCIYIFERFGVSVFLAITHLTALLVVTMFCQCYIVFLLDCGCRRMTKRQTKQCSHKNQCWDYCFVNA